MTERPVVPSFTTTRDGQHVTGLHITGPVIINHDRVTFTDCWIEGPVIGREAALVACDHPVAATAGADVDAPVLAAAIDGGGIVLTCECGQTRTVPPFDPPGWGRRRRIAWPVAWIGTLLAPWLLPTPWLVVVVVVALLIIVMVAGEADRREARDEWVQEHARPAVGWATRHYFRNHHGG